MRRVFIIKAWCISYIRQQVLVTQVINQSLGLQN